MKILFKTYDWKQARKKQIEREEKFGVKFSVSTIGLGYVIQPVITRRIEPSDFETAKELIPLLWERRGKMYSTITDLADISGFDFRLVMSMIKRLQMEGLVHCGVDRIGKWNSCGLRLERFFVTFERREKNE